MLWVEIITTFRSAKLFSLYFGLPKLPPTDIWVGRQKTIFVLAGGWAYEGVDAIGCMGFGNDPNNVSNGNEGWRCADEDLTTCLRGAVAVDEGWASVQSLSLNPSKKWFLQDA